MYLLMLADGFEEIEAITFADILRRAQIDVKTVSVTENKNVTGSHKISFCADLTCSEVDIDSVDGAALPGGLPGTYNLAESEFVKSLFISLNNQKKLVGAICAAPYALSEFGILKGKCATANPAFWDKLKEADVKKDERVCVCENIITSQGPGTAHEFALAFVEKIKGAKIATELKDEMLYN